MNTLFFLQVIQSLLWLLAYFWHFLRGSLVILLDPELKESVLYSPSRLFCCGSDDQSPDEEDEGNSRPIIRNNNVVASGKTTTVHLEEPLPVLILYWTTMVTEDGTVTFLKDVYNRDARIIAGLNKPFGFTAALE